MNEQFDVKKARRVIDSKGVKINWLAEQLGINRDLAYKYLRGKSIPNRGMVIAMAHVLNCDIKDFLSG